MNDTLQYLIGRYISEPISAPAQWDLTRLDPGVADVFEYDSLQTLPLATMRTAIHAGLAYLACIGLLYLMMKTVAPIRLWFVGLLHNVVLVVGSAWMAWGLASAAWKVLISPFGWKEAICASHVRLDYAGELTYFMYVYYLSKYLEFADTILMIVLRKRSLTVLHLFHHSIIAPLSLLWITGGWTLAWIGAFMNTVIHVFMYSHYALALVDGVGFRYKRYLTSAQIAQFFTVFCLINLHGVLSYTGVGNCHGDPAVAIASQMVNVAFLALFVNFYLQSYTKKTTLKRKND
uniref:Elongation of fatty acids protein n=1 Tax=Sexangularia sp. CB-2014 TaxID=1486929 RepID=A0A7S1YDG2_9EUKA